MIDQLGLGAARGGVPRRAIFELTIGRANRAKKKVEPRNNIVAALMPTRGAFLQHLVVAFFGLLDNSFQADVASDLMPVMVERQLGEQTRHTAIAVAKRVDAKKVEYQTGDR